MLFGEQMSKLSPMVKVVIENADVIAKGKGHQYTDIQDLIEAIFKEMDTIEMISRLRVIGIEVNIH
jgi:hypothetical protein